MGIAPVKTDEDGKIVGNNTQILGFKKIEHKILFLENCIMQLNSSIPTLVHTILHSRVVLVKVFLS